MSSPPMPEPNAELITRIEGDIRKSGFPLEMHVLNTCSTKDVGRLPNVRYEHEGQLREIDLLVFLSKLDGHHLIGTDLIIECKKSLDKPWVFFSTPFYKIGHVRAFLQHFSGFDRYLLKAGLPPVSWQILDEIRLGPYVNPDVPRCISYYEAFQNPSKPSEIYRAIDSVITCLNYRRSTRVQSRTLRRRAVISEFYLPVIVLEGPLFEATVESDQLRVCARPHIQLRTSHREETYIIDVVSRDYFACFFDEVAKFQEEALRCTKALQLPEKFGAPPRVQTRKASSRKAGARVKNARRRTRAKRKRNKRN